jgi:hypothetical protein
VRRAAGAAACGTLLVGALILAQAGPALAHQEVTVGPYHIEVGFGDEPPYAGFRNSVQFILTEKATGDPVTDLGDSLKVTVKTGAQSMPLTLEPNFEVGGDGQPGDYRAWFIPTAPGTYTFQFSGSINGLAFDRSFTSGPTTFDDVKDPAAAEFPFKAPSNAQLATRVQQEAARQSAALAAQARKGRDEAHSARLLGLIGIVAGAIGIVIGASALVMGRRRSAPAVADAPLVASRRE